MPSDTHTSNEHLMQQILAVYNAYAEFQHFNWCLSTEVIIITENQSPIPFFKLKRIPHNLLLMGAHLMSFQE